MSRPYPPRGNQRNYRPLIIIGAVAVVLIGIVLAMTGGSEDPVVEGITPPLSSSETSATGSTGETGTTGYTGPPAIDGAPLNAPPGPPTDPEEHHDHDDEVPADQATDTGPFVATATRFAELNINRPTDPGESRELNEKLVRLSTGQIAIDLGNDKGQISTAQVPIQGEVINAIPLMKEADYAEVLIVTSERVFDPETGTTLDPKYLTYIVRLDRVAGNKFAVTSWEPQI